MTADLVAFLRARLDEDQKLAFEAGDGGHDNWIFNPELLWEGPDGPRPIRLCCVDHDER